MSSKTLKLKPHNPESLTNRPLATLGISALIGLCAGGVTILYRYLLSVAETVCITVYTAIGNHPLQIALTFLTLAVLGGSIGFLIKRFPMIGGSGIPQVKGILLGHLRDRWPQTLLAKLIGGTVNTVAGLSLGREGPSIQLGACVADGIAKKLGKTRYERKIYLAGGASAGLAAAFNAPLAGVMFCLEELFKYFSPLVLLVTMTAAVTADFLSKAVFGIDPVFEFTVTGQLSLGHYWLLPVLGVLMGVLGAVYNWALLKTKALYSKIKWVQLRPVIPYVMAGVLGLTFPVVLCGGHLLIDELALGLTFGFLILAILLKFGFSMICFGSGAPGGIFFPLLVIGALWGAVFAKSAIMTGVLSDELFYNMVIFAMAGYFTAIVRAPITGIILLMEMTGSFTQLLPLTIVCLVAYVTANELGSAPVYDALLESLLESKGKSTTKHRAHKVNFEAVVHFGSALDGKQLKDVRLPRHCLLVGIQRGEEDVIPNGSTVILGEDVLMFITDTVVEGKAKQAVQTLTELE